MFDASMWPRNGNAGELGNKGKNKKISALEALQDPLKHTSQGRDSNDERSGGEDNNHGGENRKGKKALSAPPRRRMTRLSVRGIARV